MEQVAEQAEEFARHGYVLVIVGRRDGLDAACRDLVARTLDFGTGGNSD
jgi:short-subunit dehydrogenase